MSLKNVDIESAMRRLADRRIEEAMREGKFDNLPGKGKPLDLEPMPAEENARLTWWAIRLMKHNDVTPDEIRLRKQIDLFRDELAAAKTEQRVVFLVTALNAAVRNLNTLGTNAINTLVAPVSLEAERKRFRGRAGTEAADAPVVASRPAPAGIRHCQHNDCKSRNAAGARYCRVCGRRLSVAKSPAR
jgi:hypothetical protein